MLSLGGWNGFPSPILSTLTGNSSSRLQANDFPILLSHKKVEFSEIKPGALHVQSSYCGTQLFGKYAPEKARDEQVHCRVRDKTHTAPREKLFSQLQIMTVGQTLSASKIHPPEKPFRSYSSVEITFLWVLPTALLQYFKPVSTCWAPLTHLDFSWILLTPWNFGSETSVVQ